MGPLERLDIVFGLPRTDTTVGARVGSVGVMASPGVVLRDGALQPLRIGSAKRSVDLGFARMTGGALPTRQAPQGPRPPDVQTVHGYPAPHRRMSPSPPRPPAPPPAPHPPRAP